MIEARPPGSEVARQLPRKPGLGGPGALLALSDCYSGINSVIAQYAGGENPRLLPVHELLSSPVFDEWGRKCFYSEQVMLTKL